jgi:hypothetical protein
MIAITTRQDVMGRPGRRVFDMRMPVRAQGAVASTAATRSFGCVKLDDAFVDVYPGEVHHGGFYAAIKTTVTVAGGTLAAPKYICGLYLRGTSLTILPDALSAVPAGNDTNYYFWISSWYHTSEGSLTLARINHDNGIEIISMWPV